MIKYVPGYVKYDADELISMFEEHFKELGHNGGPDTFNLDRQHLEYLERNMLHASYKAVKDGETIGYAAAFIGGAPHHKGEVFAEIHAIYVSKPHRKGLIGIKLLKEFEKYLRSCYNVTYSRLHTNKNKDLSSFSDAMGYSCTDIVYTKRLEN